MAKSPAPYPGPTVPKVVRESLSGTTSPKGAQFLRRKEKLSEWWFQKRFKLVQRVRRKYDVPEGESLPDNLAWIYRVLFPIITFVHRRTAVMFDGASNTYRFGIAGAPHFSMDLATIASLSRGHIKGVYAMHIDDDGTCVAMYLVPPCGQLCLRQGKLCYFTIAGDYPQQEEHII